jgi:hypothetical protein
MPLDTTPTKTVPDLTKPSLEGLAYALRHPRETLGHQWEYRHDTIWVGYDKAGYENHCHTAGCACGMAAVLWPEQINPREQYVPEQVARCLGDGAYERFMDQDAYGIPPEYVTAEMVADKIEAYLIERRFAAS